jgi:hypothetical protein
MNFLIDMQAQNRIDAFYMFSNALFIMQKHLLMNTTLTNLNGGTGRIKVTLNENKIRNKRKIMILKLSARSKL